MFAVVPANDASARTLPPAVGAFVIALVLRSSGSSKLFTIPFPFIATSWNRNAVFGSVVSGARSRVGGVVSGKTPLPFVNQYNRLASERTRYGLVQISGFVTRAFQLLL